ncbi:MAG: phosphate acetyltransferase [Clostridiales bacterium]|nr:phosphate acetyltransferase [Clostridiales bacterium]
MGILESIRLKAKSNKKTIVLPEGTEERIIEAAAKITEAGLADVVLLGNAEDILDRGSKLDMSAVTIVDPSTSCKKDEYVEELVKLRAHKGLTKGQAEELILDPLYFGTMMVQMGNADGLVAGAINSTGDVLRPALQLIKTAPGISIVSSFFIMEVLYKEEYGQDGVLLFADCAINPNPNAQQLAEIAVTSAKTGHDLVGLDPRVAMLSFSTKGSACHEHVDKVIEATQIAKKLDPGIMLDGELQADAALVESVGQLKCPDSEVAGRANILVFPDLQSGNISYKLVERLGKARAIGPICQGIAKPVNDLSRGCSVEDIVNVVAITAIQAQ